MAETDPVQLAQRVAEAVRRACVQAARDGYEQAAISGLCAEGAAEAAVDAVRMLDVAALARAEAGDAEAGADAERASLRDAERTARAEAERAGRAKSDFLAVMSHELRTPLTAIMGYAELLQMGVPDPLTDGARGQVERIDQAARHLLALIEEILAFSRMEAGREEAEPVRADLAEVAREAAVFVHPLAHRKGLSLRVRGPDLPLHAATDRGKLRQVLVNLLFNAIKFTPQGEVALEVETAGGTALLHVRDTGVGIAPEHLERIWEPFWQVQAVDTREVGGTGLGLPLSRRIARLLGGEIAVESTPGRGSTFTVRLPLDGPPTDRSAPV
ncbi:MAG TPA: ATP-binding protein [Longimicrobiaceae bacterium]|nr:ATP-binding protein [Longimicrobiaceae bacterium]